MEKYQKHGINPLLISIATGQDVSNVSLRPTVTMLPCQYSKLVYKHINDINREFPQNICRLTCTSCGKNGDYDLGILVFPKPSDKEKHENLDFQGLGYFRCKHCNAAGEWEVAPRTQTMLAGIMAAAALGSIAKEDFPQQAKFGRALIDNSYAPRWGSDAEEYFLKKLAQAPEDAYLWNRLGNAYYRGKRPELAVFAYEQALRYDAGQVESHFSLGNILIECDELEAASEHMRQAVAFSHQYSRLSAYELRELIVAALENLLIIYDQSGKKIDILPKPNELAVANFAKSQIAATTNLDFQIDANQRQSLYPLAEVYLGERRNELPPEERALNKPKGPAKWPIVKKVNKQKPAKKNKNKKKR